MHFASNYTIFCVQQNANNEALRKDYGSRSNFIMEVTYVRGDSFGSQRAASGASSVIHCDILGRCRCSSETWLSARRPGVIVG